MPIWPENITLAQWLQCQLEIHGISSLGKKQLDFIVPYLESPLTLEEIKMLYTFARSNDPILDERNKKLLLKLLDDQSPKSDVTNDS